MEERSNSWQRFGLSSFDSFMMTDLQIVSYSVGILIIATLLAQGFLTSRKGVLQFRPRSPDPEKRGTIKAVSRTLGEWNPVEFKRPAAQPYPDWDLNATRPLPYRPFKHGNYHITMGLRTMKWDEWIELDNQFPKFHADKARRIQERGSKCCKTHPEAFDGAIELLEELYVWLDAPLVLELIRITQAVTTCPNAIHLCIKKRT